MITVVVLAVCGAALYVFLTHSFESEDGEFLAAKVQELRTDFGDDGYSTALLMSQIVAETASTRFRKYYVRVLDADGHVIGETPGMHERLPGRIFPPVQSRTEFADHPRWKEVRRGKAWLIATTVLGTDAATGKTVAVQLAADVSRDEGVLADYRNTLLLVLFLGTLAAVVLGAWAARRGLAPLRAIAHAIEKVTAEQMGDRIDAPGRWPPELAGLARAFDAMLERLDRTFQGLRRFSADVAHELRTPLNNLRGEGEVALAKPREGKEYRRVIESMLEEQTRLERIVESLLFLARVEQGREPLARKDLDLRQVAEAMVEYYRPLAEEKNLAIDCRGGARAFADPDLMQRAIGNLLSNAIRYTPNGGTLHVRIADRGAAGAELAVSDTGCGIAKEHLPRLFDRFYRVDAARADGPQGSGLGLSLVQSIMELHGGTVRVESEVGAGTTVTLVLPTGGGAAGGDP